MTNKLTSKEALDDLVEHWRIRSNEGITKCHPSAAREVADTIEALRRELEEAQVNCDKWRRLAGAGGKLLTEVVNDSEDARAVTRGQLADAIVLCLGYLPSESTIDTLAQRLNLTITDSEGRELEEARTVTREHEASLYDMLIPFTPDLGSQERWRLVSAIYNHCDLTITDSTDSEGRE